MSEVSTPDTVAAALSTVVRRLDATPVVAASGQSGIDKLTAPIREGGVFIDVKSVFDASKMTRSIKYWSL